MEVTLKNAFHLTVKCSVQPCLVVSKIVTEIVQEKAYKIIHYLLQKPILSISIFLIAIIFVMIALTISFVAMAGIACLAVFIIVVESILFLICICIFINIFSMITLTLIITRLIKVKDI